MTDSGRRRPPPGRSCRAPRARGALGDGLWIQSLADGITDIDLVPAEFFRPPLSVLSEVGKLLRDFGGLQPVHRRADEFGRASSPEPLHQPLEAARFVGPKRKGLGDRLPSHSSTTVVYRISPRSRSEERRVGKE